MPIVHPPGPTDSPLSQLLRLRRDFLGYLLAAAPLGDLVRLRPAPGATIYLLNHPDLVEEVLVTRAGQFTKSRLTRLMVGKFLGEGLVLSEGDFHNRQRRLMQPAFASRRLGDSAFVVATHTLHLLRDWRDGQAFDFSQATTQLGLGLAARLLFGIAVEDESHEITAAMSQFANSMAQRFRSLPLPGWLPTARHRAETRAIAALDAAVARILQARSTDPGGDDVATLLLRARQRSDAGMSPQQLRDEVMTLYFAGHETTAQLLNWVIAMLATHPDVAAQLELELMALRRDPCTPEELASLPLLDAVIQETLRLYPPVWVFDREPIAAVELGGYRIPAGAKIYVSPWVVQRDARWFAAPQRFDPGRFMPGWERRVSRYSYFPFGYGPRNCIGRGFAEINAKISLAVMLRRYRFTLAPGQDLRPAPAATLRPADGLRVIARRVG